MEARWQVDRSNFGRFAHSFTNAADEGSTFGVDVDALDEEGLMAHDPMKSEHGQKLWGPESVQQHGQVEGIAQKTGHIHHTSIMDVTKYYRDDTKEGRVVFQPPFAGYLH